MDRDAILRALAALAAELGRLRPHRGPLRGRWRRDRPRVRRPAVDPRHRPAFVPKAEVYRAAARVAEELDLPDGWLHDAVKAFLLGPDPLPDRDHRAAGAAMRGGEPEMVLVLKCLAHRIGEDDDVRRLADRAGLGSPDQVLDLVVRVAGARYATAQVQASSSRRCWTTTRPTARCATGKPVAALDRLGARPAARGEHPP